MPSPPATPPHLSKNPPLKASFPATSDKNWQNLVETFLRGKTFESLVKRSEDGIVKGPLWTQDSRPTQFLPQTRLPSGPLSTTPWHISVPVEDPDVTYANTQILADLKGGASALRLMIANGTGKGVSLRNVSDLKRLLSAVFTEFVPLTFAPQETALSVLSLFKTTNIFSSARINFGHTGTQDLNSLKAELAELPENWKFLTVDGADIHDSGATDVLELAVMSAKFITFMRELTPALTTKHVIFEIAADQDGHKTIAKIRAARRLFGFISESFGISDAKFEIHAVTSKRMMQSTDPWTNFLRLTSAGFGAVCGGADTLTLRPFTDALGLPTSFGHRTARNIQLLLMEESHLGHVDDPAYGSFYHEHLSDQLSQHAWKKLQEIEEHGGLTTYTDSGALSRDLDACRAAREVLAAPIVGVTLHPSDTPRPAKVRKAKT